MFERPDGIIEWAARANPGDRAVYGRGLSPGADYVRAMQPLVDAGAIVPLRKREGAEFLFLVERGTRPLSRHAHRPSRGPVRKRSVKRSVLSVLFNTLVLAARDGRPCPSNTQLAARCGLSSKQAASHQMHLLAERGRIRIEGGTNGAPRVVTILWGRHAGKSTS